MADTLYEELLRLYAITTPTVVVSIRDNVFIIEYFNPRDGGYTVLREDNPRRAASSILGFAVRPLEVKGRTVGGQFIRLAVLGYGKEPGVDELSMVLDHLRHYVTRSSLDQDQRMGYQRVGATLRRA